MPGSKESHYGLATAARSSPRSLASVPPHFLDSTQAKLFGKWFLQIIPLRMQQTMLLGTNFTSLFQAPSFYHTLGPFGLRPPAFSQRFVRAEEAALGVSFNAQSQAPDIPGISSRAAFRNIQHLYRPNPSPGHPLAVVASVYGRALGFFQRPRSSS